MALVITNSIDKKSKNRFKLKKGGILKNQSDLNVIKTPIFNV